MGRVRVQKREYESHGGDPGDDTSYIDEININEDHIDARGVYLQGDSGEDELVHLGRDSSSRMTLEDVDNDFILSDVVTETKHKVLRQLIHFIEDGPAEGFTSGAYRETTGTAFPTAIVWWESSSKQKMIVERLITWTGVLPTTDQWKVYDTDGTTVLWIVTDSISYSGVFETSRTRSIVAGP